MKKLPKLPIKSKSSNLSFGQSGGAIKISFDIDQAQLQPILDGLKIQQVADNQQILNAVEQAANENNGQLMNALTKVLEQPPVMNRLSQMLFERPDVINRLSQILFERPDVINRLSQTLFEGPRKERFMNTFLELIRGNPDFVGQLKKILL